MYFGHVLTAMVTPFDIDGQIDFKQMTTLIEHLLENGTDGLVINGTTAEAAVLSTNEKEDIYKHVVAVVDKRVPVLAGAGTNDTRQSIINTKRAEQLGVDGIMLVTPYYNRPNQNGLYAHFKAIASETTLPIMLYNIPSRCGVHMDAKTVIQLSELHNIVALKEASGDLEHVAKILSSTEEDFYVYSGEDSITLPMLAIGATGVVSVASHIIGQQLHDMIDAFKNGEVKKATDIHLKYFSIMRGIFMTPSPAPIKAALKMNGLDVGSVRLPLVDLTTAELDALREIIR